MDTIQNEIKRNRMLLCNMLMELIWMKSKSSMGLSNNQEDQLRELWSLLSKSGREYFKEWASDNDLTIPSFL